VASGDIPIEFGYSWLTLKTIIVVESKQNTKGSTERLQNNKIDSINFLFGQQTWKIPLII